MQASQISKLVIATRGRSESDFPARVTKARANLYPFMKSCHEKQKDAYLKYDNLVIEGQSYIFIEELGRPVLSQ